MMNSDTMTNVKSGKIKPEDIPMNACSPLGENGNVSKEKEVSVSKLCSIYKKSFDIDIGYLIPDDCHSLKRFRCLQSNYRFYEPTTIVGDSDFYEKLQKYDWYYMSDKWEFREALSHISKVDDIRVLEIGSAKGDFLRMLRNHNPNAKLTGLELNQAAATESRQSGFDVRIKTTNEHVTEHQGCYDVIASFQVLEHIPNPMRMLHDIIDMLKPGGTLIIGVPDNSQRAYPSIFVSPESALNMPPHHLGLWDIPSLSFLTKALPLRLDYLAIEPATAPHHSNSYRSLMKHDLITRFGRIFGLAIYAIARPFYNHALSHLSKYLPAHTVLAVYRKR